MVLRGAALFGEEYEPAVLALEMRRRKEIAIRTKIAILTKEVIAQSARFYPRKATLCTPAISKRLRQRMFLQAIMSSRRSM